MEKKIAEFTDERFYEHIKILIDVGLQTERVDMFATLSFLNDLQDLIYEMKEEMKQNETKI